MLGVADVGKPSADLGAERQDCMITVSAPYQLLAKIF